MDLLRRVLVAIHPRDWRQRYGEEFQALLEDTRLTPSAAADVLRHCAALHARTHRRALWVAFAALLSVTCEIAAKRAGLTDNILWAPRNPLRALALTGTTLPWAMALTVSVASSRRAAGRA
jgi:hypothetical protein